MDRLRGWRSAYACRICGDHFYHLPATMLDPEEGKYRSEDDPSICDVCIMQPQTWRCASCGKYFSEDDDQIPALTISPEEYLCIACYDESPARPIKTTEELMARVCQKIRQGGNK